MFSSSRAFETSMDTHETEQAQRRTDEREQKADTSVTAKRSDTAKPQSSKSATKKKRVVRKNNVRKLRTERMMSKAELARRAGLSTLTIDRVEKGMPCRMDTKRKILEALGLTPSDRVAVFGEED